MNSKESVWQLLRKINEVDLMPNAHLSYKPSVVPVLSFSQIMMKMPRFASVNILLYRKDGEWYFPLIVRKQDKRDKHSGEISLPGGQKEHFDSSFAETAVRETHEEIGIRTEDIKVIREISPVYVPLSNFYVHAFISYTTKSPEFFLQESEVAAYIEFPLSSILSLNEQPVMMALPTTEGLHVPVIELNNYIIWGATSMILSEFRQLIQGM